MDAPLVKINHKALLYFLTVSACLLWVGVQEAAYGIQPNAQTASETQDTLSPEGLRDLQLRHAGFVLFDARNLKSYNASHIEGAVLPLPEEYFTAQDLYATRLISTPPDADAALAKAMRNYAKNTPIVTYCNKDCGAAGVLANKLRQLGFTDVKTMKDGIQTWEGKGYPVVKGAKN